MGLAIVKCMLCCELLAGKENRNLHPAHSSLPHSDAAFTITHPERGRVDGERWRAQDESTGGGTSQFTRSSLEGQNRLLLSLVAF